ncbi:MAG: hypothetical protein ABL929_10035, partial [Ferruginibacter sp.]
KNMFSKNKVQQIKHKAKNTYAVHTFFKVQRIHTDTSLHFKSNIIFKLNNQNKIIYIDKEKVAL